jgi:hypothetical protein
MDPILIVSGLLAVLGGGAGAVAWYRKNYPAASGSSDGTIPPIPPVAAGQDPTTNAQGFVNLAGGAIAGVDPSGNVTVNAGVVSPYINPGRSTVAGFNPAATVAPAPTKGATLLPGVTAPIALSFNGIEAHV